MNGYRPVYQLRIYHPSTDPDILIGSRMVEITKWPASPRAGRPLEGHTRQFYLLPEAASKLQTVMDRIDQVAEIVEDVVDAELADAIELEFTRRHRRRSAS